MPCNARAASDSVACCCSNGHARQSSSLPETSPPAVNVEASDAATAIAKEQPAGARAEPSAHPAFARGDWDAIVLSPRYRSLFWWRFLRTGPLVHLSPSACAAWHHIVHCAGMYTVYTPLCLIGLRITASSGDHQGTSSRAVVCLRQYTADVFQVLIDTHDLCRVPYVSSSSRSKASHAHQEPGHSSQAANPAPCSSASTDGCSQASSPPSSLKESTDSFCSPSAPAPRRFFANHRHCSTDTLGNGAPRRTMNVPPGLC